MGGVVLGDLGVCGDLGLERRNVAEAQDILLGHTRECTSNKSVEKGKGRDVRSRQAVAHEVAGTVLGKQLVKDSKPLGQSTCGLDTGSDMVYSA